MKRSTSVKALVCDHAAGVVTTTFPKVKAHATAKVTVVAIMPGVAEKTAVSLVVHAHADQGVGGEEPRDGDAVITGHRASR